MCLAIPGEVISVEGDALRMGQVSFGGVVKSVCLAYVPEAGVGDHVLVHAGFAIAAVSAAHARAAVEALATRVAEGT